MDENMKKYWLERYKEDKIGTIAKLSQAMQHMAWLREWQRVHGDEPRIKPITKKVNGEKVKIGESDIAVAWSELDEFFRKGNEYGDIETVKFLMKRIESGDVSELTDTEIHELSEKENVKWSDGKHSLNPFQGYLYSFTDDITGIFALREVNESYGEFTPMGVYIHGNNGPTDADLVQSITDDAYSRVFATKLIKKFIQQEGKEAEYKDFLNFDITSVITQEQIADLDKTIVHITHSPRFEYFMDEINGNAEYEKELEAEIKREVEIEIKKDSDRIENVHKVFVALETENFDELLKEPETAKWVREVYEKEISVKEQNTIVTDRSKHMMETDEVVKKVAEALGLEDVDMSAKMHDAGKPYMGHEDSKKLEEIEEQSKSEIEVEPRATEIIESVEGKVNAKKIIEAEEAYDLTPAETKKGGLISYVKGLIDKIKGMFGR